MFTYNEIVRSCKRLKLNPEKRGENINARMKNVLSYDKTFDFSSINFPEKEKVQVEKIGKLLNNLVSQKNFPAVYHLGTTEGKKEKIRDRNIDKVVPMIQE